MRLGKSGAASDGADCLLRPLLPYFALAFAASHSVFDMETQPWPLQLFMPLQLFFADLHSEVPLQELTPEQCTVAVSAATETPVSPDVKNMAAVAAIAAFDNLVICIVVTLVSYDCQRDCCALSKTEPTGKILLSTSFNGPSDEKRSMPASAGRAATYSTPAKVVPPGITRARGQNIRLDAGLGI
jgi:hypothetical protein